MHNILTAVNNKVLYIWKLLRLNFKCSHHQYDKYEDNTYVSYLNLVISQYVFTS
jgi:hypothetical protein